MNSSKSMRLYPGLGLSVSVNQGDRDATVLAVLGNDALIEYDMPNGTTALRVVDVDDPDILRRRYSYTAVPLRWLRAMLAEGSDWTGRPQQSHALAPSVRALWREKTGEEWI